MRDWVTALSLLAGVICFVLYACEAFVAIRAKAAAPEVGNSPEIKALVANPTGVSVQELAAFVDAIAKLTDSLAKAGPALTSIIGAILFFAIAAISSGALHDAPAGTSNSTTTKTTVTAPAENTTAPAP